MSEDKKVQIRITDVLTMLKEGKTRDDIGERYGLKKSDVKRLFNHPDLKGKKTIKKKELPFEIIEGDVEVENQEVVAEEIVPENVEAVNQEWNNSENSNFENDSQEEE